MTPRVSRVARGPSMAVPALVCALSVIRWPFSVGSTLLSCTPCPTIPRNSGCGEQKRDNGSPPGNGQRITDNLQTKAETSMEGPRATSDERRATNNEQRATDTLTSSKRLPSTQLTVSPLFHHKFRANHALTPLYTRETRTRYGRMRERPRAKCDSHVRTPSLHLGQRSLLRSHMRRVTVRHE